jgi:aminoglycoside phosphotransferase (APT) family kinase protein
VPDWNPEVVVDAALARRLIREQFPELEPRDVRLLSEGWDSTVFVVDGTWVFRFPRRAIVIPGFEVELALLPRLAPLLPVAIPAATYVRRARGRVPVAVRRVEGLPDPEPTAVCHGDLHFRHVLVGDDGSVTGIIDWIDVCRADPGIDLLLVWSFFPPEGRRVFLDVYGPVAPESLLRARVLAFFLCATLALYGRAEGAAAIEREALEGLKRAADD